MDRKITGYYLIGLSVFSTLLAIGISLMDLSDEESIWLFQYMMVAFIIGSFILGFCGMSWAGRVRYDKNGFPKTQWLFRGSALSLYASSTVFGTTAFLSILIFGQDAMSQSDGMQTTLVLVAVIAIAILSLITVIILRASMRDPDNIEEFGWDSYYVYKSTGLLRILAALFLPVLILLLFILLFGAVLLKSATDTMVDAWTCPQCHSSLSGGNTCPRCGAHR